MARKSTASPNEAVRGTARITTPLRTHLPAPGCDRFEIVSSLGGCPYEIFVSVPEAEAPPGGFPAIFVLDGNADFVTVTETLRRVGRRPKATGIHPAVVVGIGYPRTVDYNADRRHRDFTREPASPGMFSDIDRTLSGGQVNHIAFLTDDLLPSIAARYRVCDARRTLLGHSLAGYFTLEVLAQRPDTFAGYVSISPSIWWDRPGLSQRIATRIGPGAMQRRVFVTVGRWESERAPWQAEAGLGERSRTIRLQRRMVDNAREIADEIVSAFGSSAAVQFEIGEDDDHATIVTSALCRALRFTHGYSGIAQGIRRPEG